MSFLNLLSYFSLLAFLINFVAPVEATGTLYLHHNCSSTKNFTSNPAYRFNLNSLLSSLSSYASGTTDFYNATAGNGGTSDAVYGLFMCRGDVPSQVCQDCVANATNRLLSDSKCPYSEEGVVWYDECLVRFSDRYFFSVLDKRPKLVLQNVSDVPNQESIRRVLATLLNDTVVEAARSGPQGTKKFATRQANLSQSQSVLFSTAQCTPDLSQQDCKKCLNDTEQDLSECCVGKQGGRVMYPSCFLRFGYYRSFGGPTGKARRLSRTIIIVVVVIVDSVILSCFGYCLWRKRSKSYKALLKENFGSESTTLETLQLSLATIEVATNKFSHENRIGKGGFGEVYKGVLPDGKEIAVKRLSRSSGQGAVEFKNEILLIAKLQHRNLVALLGFCQEGEEKLLVYEYVPNKSLDYFLFGSQRKRILSWSERYKIIGGIARGILYLHEYSRLKIIHRDIKPSNVLLDDEMNPKISGFGLARIVAINESEGSTNRIVGTYGYMSPEYAMLGQFSKKSDVFSFGVMILEIVSGKKNASSHESQYVDGLLS